MYINYEISPAIKRRKFLQILINKLATFAKYYEYRLGDPILTAGLDVESSEKKTTTPSLICRLRLSLNGLYDTIIVEKSGKDIHSVVSGAIYALKKSIMDKKHGRHIHRPAHLSVH